MFYCGTIVIGNGPVLEISGGAGKALWASWRSNDCIVVVRLTCSLLQSSEAFLNVCEFITISVPILYNFPIKIYLF